MIEDSQIQELYEKIFQEYDGNVKGSASIQRFLFRLGEGKSSSEEVSKYASDLGECAANALDRYLVSEYLPDGTLTWDILSGTVDPLMHIVFDLVVDAASEVTRKEDVVQGIHLNPIVPEYPAERIKALKNSMLRRYEPENEKQSV